MFVNCFLVSIYRAVVAVVGRVKYFELLATPDYPSTFSACFDGPDVCMLLEYRYSCADNADVVYSEGLEIGYRWQVDPQSSYL